MKQGCLFLLDNLGVGGSERKTILVANKLAQGGLPVHMVFLNVTSDVSNTLDRRISYFSADRQGKLDLRAVRKIREYLGENDIGAVWAVNLYPTLYMYLAARPFRNHIRLFGSSNITVFRNHYERLKMLLYVPIIRSLDGFIFGSQQQMAVWRKKYFIPQGIADYIYNGVDLTRFSPSSVSEERAKVRKRYRFDEGHIVIGMVAQLRKEKAHTDLLEAFLELRRKGLPVKLILVGEGAERKAIESYISGNSLEDAVVLTGQVDDVRPILFSIDIFTLTSRAVETFSNAALEAMAMEHPVILSDLSGAREMVEEGDNGYLYPPGDIEELVRKLEKIILDEDIDRMGKNARCLVEKNFSSGAMVERYRKMIWPDMEMN